MSTSSLPTECLPIIEWGGVLLERLNLSEDRLIERPLTAEELINIIAGFEGLITCRMHSSIAATSLGIPSIVLSWNPKIDKYFEALGYPERAIQVDNLDAEYIVDAYEKALAEGVSEDALGKMKSLAKESVSDYINMII